MKKNFKRTLAAVMAAALTVTMIGMPSETDAAKKIKLSKSTVTVTKGKTKKVTIKNVKKNQVKKLKITANKKAKKIATVKKSGKTALKVKGKKAGSAKFTVNVTVKGKKKATKLKLTVKVKKATPSTGGGATAQTQAPGGTTQTQAPGGTNPGGTAPTLDPGTPQTQAPGDPTREPRPTNSAKPSKEPTTPPRQWGEVTPVPQAQKVKSMILKYTDEVQTEEKTEGCGKLSEMGKIAFRDAKEGYTIGKDEKFDILNYDRIVIKLNAKDRAKMGEGDNGEPYSGKIGLSSTDSEVFGAHVDGFITQYESDGQTRGKLIFLNDIDGMTEEKGGTSPIAEKTYKVKDLYEDGYVIEYKIPGDISKTNWWTPDDISNYCDCINFQLADKDTYDDFYVEEIQLLTDKTATAENLEIKAGKDTIKVDESTDLTVSMKDVPDYAEISKVEWSADENVAVSEDKVADNKKTATAKVTGKKEAAKAAVTAKVTVSIDGKDFEVEVSKDIKVDKKDGQGGEDDKTEVKATDLELKADADEVEVDATTKLTLALKNTAPKGAAIKSADWSVSPADGAGLTGDAATERTFTARKAGKVTVTAKVTAEAGGKEFGDLTVTKEITVKAKQQGGDEVKVTAADLEVRAEADEVEVDGTTKLTVVLKDSAPNGAAIKSAEWSVSPADSAALTGDAAAERTFKGVKAGDVTVTVKVTATAGGKDFTDLSVTKDIKVKKKKTVVPEGALAVSLDEETIKVDGKTNATVSLTGAGTESMKITAVEWSAADDTVATCGANAAAQDNRSGSTEITGLHSGATKIEASVTVQAEDQDPSDPVTVESRVLMVDEKTVVEATDITISIDSAQIRKNETATVEVELDADKVASGAEITGIEWAVSDTACVETTAVSTATSQKVTQEFKGLQVKDGKITITAKVKGTDDNGTFEYDKAIQLSVVTVPVKDPIVVAKPEAVIVGETAAIEIRVDTQSADLKYTDPKVEVTWELASEESASIETAGEYGERVIIDARKAGTITVTATIEVTDNGETGYTTAEYKIEILPELEPDVAIKGKKIVAKDGELTLEVENNGEGQIDNVTWPKTVDGATIVSNDDKTATVTVNKAGDVTIEAEVKVTRDKKGTTQTKTVTRNITVKGVELEVKDITKTQFAANETAGIEVGFKGDANGVEITGVDWTVDEEGIVEVQEGKVKTAAVLAGKAVGTVTVIPVVTVSAEGDDDEVEITLEGVEFTVTPLEYEIGVELDLTNFAGGMKTAALDQPITINRTDEVEVVCSINKGDESVDTPKSVVIPVFAFSAREYDTSDTYNDNNIISNRVLEIGGEVKDNVSLKLNNYNKWFVDPTTTLKTVGVQLWGALQGSYVVTVEKLIVSPTKKVPVSLYVPDKVGNIPGIAELYVDTDKEYTVEWISSNGNNAPIVADPEDQSKGIITAKGQDGYIRITAVVKIDGKEVAREQSQNIQVDPELITVAVNQQAVANFDGENHLQYDGGCGLTLDTPLTLPKDKKVEVLYSVKKVDKQGKETLYGGNLRICMFDSETESIWGTQPVLASQYYASNNRNWPLNQENGYVWGTKEAVQLDKVSFSGWGPVTGEAGDKMVITLKQLIVVNK